MNHNSYQELVKKHMPKRSKIKKLFLAFFSGGMIGIGSQLLSNFLVYLFKIPIKDSYVWVGIILVLVTALLTGLGFFDVLVSFFEAGLIIPTTGFSHAVISGALDGKREGFIVGISPSMFKLCASVIVSGVTTSFILSIIGWLIYG